MGNTTKYIALYPMRSDKPCGIICAESYDETVRGLRLKLGGDYRTEMVTEREADKILQNLFGGFSGIEKLVREGYRGEK